MDSQVKLSNTNMENYLGKSEKLGVDVIHTQVKFLQGKVLTIVDASYSDKVQRKAIKDLINKAFSDQLTWIDQLCYPDIDMMTSDEAESTIEDFDRVCKEAEEIKE